MGAASVRGSVLIVEDNGIIGMTLVDDLEAHGYEAIGPVASGSGALRWLEARRPDAALVDVMLRDGLCIELVQQLKHRRVPFAIYSGHNQMRGEPAFRDVPWVTKPATFAEIMAALDSLRCRSEADRTASTRRP